MREREEEAVARRRVYEGRRRTNALVFAIKHPPLAFDVLSISPTIMSALVRVHCDNVNIGKGESRSLVSDEGGAEDGGGALGEVKP